MGYNETISSNKLWEIRKNIFNGNFAIKNQHLYRSPYLNENEEDQIISKNKLDTYRKLATYIKYIKIQRKLIRRNCSSNIQNDPWINEFLAAIDYFSDNSLLDVLIGKDEKINVFKPHKNEVLIKKINKEKNDFY